MADTTVSTKGQVVIPKEIRERLGWEPGTSLEVEDRGDRVVLRRVRRAPRTTIDDLRGCLPYNGPPKTVEEMDEGIARGARERR
jgi:AbrB family looped-hinge helix DNA binding protein